MNTSKWEDWAIEMLRRRSLSEPPAHVLERAYAIGARRRRVAPSWFAAAAVLLVAVTGAILMHQQTQVPSLPPLPPDSTMRSGEVTTIEPRGEVDRMPAQFSWETVDGAASYRMRLLAVDDTVLFEQTTGFATAELPLETAGLMHAAVTYFWQVDAFDASGGIIARSQRTRFEVRP